MQSNSRFLLNGIPVNVGPILNRSSSFIQIATVPSTEEHHNFTSLHPIVNVQQQTPVVENRKLSFSTTLQKSHDKVNVNDAKPKHKRLNDFNVIRHANTVVCGPLGPILDPLSHDLPHKRWPYSAKTKPRVLNNQQKALHSPVKPREPKKPVSQLLFASSDVVLTIKQSSTDHSQPSSASFLAQQQNYNKSLANVVELPIKESSNKIDMQYIMVCVSDASTQTEEEYFQTHFSSENLFPNGLIPASTETDQSVNKKQLSSEEFDYLDNLNTQTIAINTDEANEICDYVELNIRSNSKEDNFFVDKTAVEPSHNETEKASIETTYSSFDFTKDFSQEKTKTTKLENTVHNIFDDLPVKRKRGRPRKTDVLHYVFPKRARGRPRKYFPVAPQAVIKRPRGRPRKDFSQVHLQSPKVSVQSPTMKSDAKTAISKSGQLLNLPN